MYTITTQSPVNNDEVSESDQSQGPVCRMKPRVGWRETLVPDDCSFVPEERPFPTPAQLDLLRAALLPAAQAAPAWQRWKARGLELQTVTDNGSMRLFPRLWANREAAGIGPDDRTLLKGICRHTIARNAVVIANAINAAGQLNDAGIPVLFIKGAAILAFTGDKLGFRRTADADLLVPELDAERAVKVLLRGGYQSKIPGRAPPPGVVHAWAYRSPGGTEVDLHFRAYKCAGDDTDMFEKAVEAALLGRTVRIPSPSDCLVNAVVNGFQIGGAPVRWIADSLVLISGAEIDWDLVLGRSHRPGMTLELSSGLNFLAREFAAPVPGYVLDELHRRPTDWREQAAHWAALNRFPGAIWLEQIARYRAYRLHYGTGATRDFLGYLAQNSGVRRRDLLSRLPRKTLEVFQQVVDSVQRGSNPSPVLRGNASPTGNSE